jgi:DNA-directed RNA polymerase alpha subunit
MRVRRSLQERAEQEEDGAVDDLVGPGVGEPIEALGLTERPLKALKHSGVWTVGDLMGLSAADLLRLVNFGEQSLAEMRQALWERDLWLKDGRWGDP